MFPSTLLPVSSTRTLLREDVYMLNGPKFTLLVVLYPPTLLTFKPVCDPELCKVGIPKELISTLKPLSVPLDFSIKGKL